MAAKQRSRPDLLDVPPHRKGVGVNRTYIVTVTTTSYIDVDAKDEANAARIANHRLCTEFGTTAGRVVEIVNVEEG